VFLDDNVAVGQDGHWAYGNVPFNGVQDLGGSDDPTFDAAKLWGTIIEGQVVLSEEARLPDAEEDTVLDTEGIYPSDVEETHLPGAEEDSVIERQEDYAFYEDVFLL
ncbi:hypothetical protein ACOTTU_24470, partial [Roseobacter sp. EG26]|uniref:hypothetical protein n=1 Tax=Roseobacter sp. EG26 TaxID=3412477 RepID=UPI003CE4675A